MLKEVPLVVGSTTGSGELLTQEEVDSYQQQYLEYTWGNWFSGWRNFQKNQQDIPAEYEKIFQENFWELLA